MAKSSMAGLSASTWRKSANVVASLNYAPRDTLSFFADISAGYSRTRQFQDVLNWEYRTPTAVRTGSFTTSSLERSISGTATSRLRKWAG